MVKEGFKQTEAGSIPEDWSIKRIMNIASVNPESLDGATNPNYSFGYISLENVEVGRLNGCSYEVFCSSPSRARRVVRRGDILFGNVRPNLKSHYLVNDEISDMVCSTGFSVVRCKPSEANPAYVYYLFLSEIIERQVSAIISGSNYPAVNRTDVEGLYLPLPELAEQKAIASTISDVDALIDALERLIDKKRDIKQGAIQELLTGKKRLPGFDGEWVEKQLGELGIFLKGCGIKKDESMSGSIPCIRYGEIYTVHDCLVKDFHSWISDDVAEKARRINRGDILFAGSGETKEEIGKCVAFTGEQEAYAGGDIVILRPTTVNSTFLGYYLNTEAINQQKARRGQGDAVVHISSSALSEIDIKIPGSIDEQDAIAGIFSDIDLEIETLVKKLAKIRQLKQGMMQELLTGRIRLA
jgi:type I restriction enzyme, S subunit